MSWWLKAILLFLSLFIGSWAMAYPQYSARYNILSCTACHVSPVGGGPKTVNGKLFGAHGYSMNKWLQQDYVSVDFRALYYYSQRATDTGGGMGIMSGSVAGHAPLDSEKRIHLVIEHNIAGFAAAPFRDTYALFNFTNSGRSEWLESLLVGRFRAPFGIISDEHRTYTRIQTATEWFTFQTGIMASGSLPQLHYDLALVNGENSSGQNLAQGQAERFGGILNARWMPGPFFLGASYSEFHHAQTQDNRRAASLYLVLSLARWTNDQWPLELRLEHARAWNWDQNLAHGFASSNFVSVLGNTESRGYLAWLDWQITPRLVATYKFDYLTPDKNFPADCYLRHGFGFRYYIGPNAMVYVRTELARATPPVEGGSTSEASQKAIFGILQLDI